MANVRRRLLAVRWPALSGAWLLALAFVLLLPLATPRVYATDEVQYYVYLRSLRFDGDFDFANDYRRMAELNPRSGIEGSLLQPDRIRAATGLYGNIAPIGSAILWSPFFLLADGVVQAVNAFGAGIPADGFSHPYMLAVCYASAIYGLLGLLISWRMVRRYVSDFGATLASVAIWLATPLVFYMYIQMPFAHATGFFCTALFLGIWQETRPALNGGRNRSLRAWAALALAGGLMTMTREQLGLFLLVPALEALGDYARTLRARHWAAVLRQVWPHTLFVGLFVLSLVPQLAIYQILNGSPRPAGEVAGKLNLCSPHALDTLVDFDPRPEAWCVAPGEATTARTPAWSRGALLWSPILLPALIGLALLWRRDRLLLAACLAAFLAQTWINGAFGTTWHLTGAFGFRRLLECTPIFILGLALLIDWLTARAGRGWPLVLAGLFIAWNAGLVLNATVFNAETNLRRGLTWPDLWRWQLEAPLKVVGQLNDLLFHRCRLLENGRCE